MKIHFKLKIQQKIQVFIISASILIYVFAVGYISFNARKMAYNDATLFMNSTVKENAREISENLNIDMSIVKTLSYAYLVYNNLPQEEWKKIFHDMYYEVLEKNKHIYSIWDSWELSVLDPNWKKSYGRYSNTITRNKNGSISKFIGLKSIEAESQIYDKDIKKRRVPSIWEPYYDTFSAGEKYLMTTLNSPIMQDDKYIGIVAVDITLDKLQEMVSKITPFKNSYAYIVSFGGIIAGHPDENFINQKLADVFPEDFKVQNIEEKIKTGKPFNYISKTETGVKTYYSFAPIIIEGTNTPWSIAISVPVDTIMEKAIRNFWISIIIGILGIFLLVFIISVISKKITNPLIKITELLNHMSTGRIDDNMRVTIKTGDEIEEMSNALNNSIDGLNKKVVFANQIEQGELETKFDSLSDEDFLGKALIDMRNSLLNAKGEDEKRKIEDEKRRWANEGLAKFSEILRQNNDNLEKLSSEIIINLINYLNANQGGLFILNTDGSENIHLNLIASFAYDRKKYLQKQFLIGEGLVGTSAIEKKILYITDIPDDYIKITSGLGGANPTSLLIVPLKLENEVLGVIEIASFNTFEKYEIEFVEKLAESIASTLSSVRINIRTSELLEKSQQQAEEMAAQEEEMRQNMEELQTTQEEAARREQEMQSIISALDKNLLIAELDSEMNVRSLNQKFRNVFGIHSNIDSEVELKDIFNKSDNILPYREIWGQIINGNIKSIEQKHIIGNDEYWFLETLSPALNSEGRVSKVLLIAIDISKNKKNEKELEVALKELEKFKRK